MRRIEEDGRTYRVIWDEYFREERCRFHEHGGMQCDRQHGELPQP